MSDVKNRRPMNGHHVRRARGHRAHVPSNGTLPSTEILAAIGAPAEVVAAVAKWHELVVSERDQARLAAAANAAAEEAVLEYRAGVREALESGGDPAAVESAEEKHRAVAKAHIGFHDEARIARARLGQELGHLLEDAAPDLLESAEKAIEKAAGQVRGALAVMEQAWADYGKAFELRRWLSHVALDGGGVRAFHGQTPMPKEAQEALNALEHALGELDRLKSDEAEVRAFREANA